MFGVSSKSLELIFSAISDFKEIEKASIYGSRAVGNFKTGSDIDIVLYGKEITQQTVLKLKVKLEHDLPIPYFFDLIHYETISKSELKAHIDSFAKVFYSSLI
ncbi:MAG: nucleotidyltransferase domain-containing protein [Draconibacterium sp.]|nr:nucleotidyltransferase domain-containing protein [Draconibacterium sp.]